MNMTLFMALVLVTFCNSMKLVTRLTSFAASGAVALLPFNVALATAEKGTPAPVYGLKKESLLKCKTFSNCISSSSIQSIDKYGRPWSFPSGKSGKEEFGEIRKVLEAQEYLQVADVDEDKLYIRATAKSAVPPSGTDDVEFLVNGLDHIITYRSNSREVVMAGTTNVPDGGSNRNRLASVQRALGVKEMSVNTDADAYFDSKPDFFSYQKQANKPSAINFIDNSVPVAPIPALEAVVAN